MSGSGLAVEPKYLLLVVLVKVEVLLESGDEKVLDCIK